MLTMHEGDVKGSESIQSLDAKAANAAGTAHAFS